LPVSPRRSASPVDVVGGTGLLPDGSRDGPRPGRSPLRWSAASAGGHCGYGFPRPASDVCSNRFCRFSNPFRNVRIPNPKPPRHRLPLRARADPSGGSMSSRASVGSIPASWPGSRHQRCSRKPAGGGTRFLDPWQSMPRDTRNSPGSCPTYEYWTRWRPSGGDDRAPEVRLESPGPPFPRVPSLA